MTPAFGVKRKPDLNQGRSQRFCFGGAEKWGGVSGQTQCMQQLLTRRSSGDAIHPQLRHVFSRNFRVGEGAGKPGEWGKGGEGGGETW